MNTNYPPSKSNQGTKKSQKTTTTKKPHQKSFPETFLNYLCEVVLISTRPKLFLIYATQEEAQEEEDRNGSVLCMLIGRMS